MNSRRVLLSITLLMAILLAIPVPRLGMSLTTTTVNKGGHQVVHNDETVIVIPATSPGLVIRNGRYQIQSSTIKRRNRTSSLSSISSPPPLPPLVAAFDFPGITLEVIFGGAKEVSFEFLEVMMKEGIAHEHWSCFNATLWGSRTGAARRECSSKEEADLSSLSGDGDEWSHQGTTIICSEEQFKKEMDSKNFTQNSRPWSYTLFPNTGRGVSKNISTNPDSKPFNVPVSSLDPNMTYLLRIVKMTEADWNDIVPTPNFIELHSVTLVGFGDSDASPTTSTFGTTTSVSGSAFPRVYRQEDFMMIDEEKKKKTYSSSSDANLPPLGTAATTRLFNASRRIEFIGDSITAGYCNLCKNLLGPTNTSFNSPSNQSYALSWAQRTCEMFNADCHTEAWSGYGMAENCCGGTTILPDIFNRTLASVNTSTWNFTYSFASGGGSGTNSKQVVEGQSKWKAPHAVVINLGTNDFDSPAGKNISTNYTRNYFEMLRLLRRVYFVEEHFTARHQGTPPPLNVFLACGPMSTAYCNDVFTIINATGGVAPPNMTHHHHHNRTDAPTSWSVEREEEGEGEEEADGSTYPLLLLDEKVVEEYRVMDWSGLQTHFLDQRHVLTKNNTCCGHPDVAADEHLAHITWSRLNEVLKWD